MVHIIFLLKTSHPIDYHKWSSETRDMIFAKIAQTLFSNKGERETDRGTPQVNGPHSSVTREQRRDLTAGDLVDGEVSVTAKSTIVLLTSLRDDW